MNKRIILTALWIGVFMAGFASPVNAQTGIAGIDPQEGTVGTEVTVYGAGFGMKQGEVLIGEEKCKVQAWSDSQITCEVQKPQAPGDYTLTVLFKGDKKPAEPLTFSYFAMRQPKLFPGELNTDGVTVTVMGEFFGDKKGELHIGYLEDGTGEEVVEKQKILDWSKDAIRFEIPAGLDGEFVLKVSNQVGAGFAMLDLGGGTALLGEMPYAPGWPEGMGFHSKNNGSGVWFKGNFYVFYLNNPYWPDTPTIQCRIFTPASGSFASCPGTMPAMYTDAIPTSVVFKNEFGVDMELWLFHVSGSKTILFSRFDGNNWLYIPKGDGTFSQTTPILGGAITDDKTFEVAAVFDPVDEMVRLYSTYQHHICSAYSQNGVNWSGAGCVYPYSAHGLSAVYYQGIVNDKPYDTIVSFEDNLGQDFLYYLKGMGSGMLVDQYIIPDAAHRPSLVNLNHDPTGEVAMIYKSSNDADSSMIRKLGTNGVWSASTKLFTLQDPGAGWGYYNMTYIETVGYLEQTGAIIPWPDGTHHLLLFYLYDWATWMADTNDYVGPFLKIVDVETLE